MEGNQEEELGEKEIEFQLNKIKKKKMTGIDGIVEEAWFYSDGQIREGLKELLKRMWKGEGLPEEQTKGVITPIHKKRDTIDVRNDIEVTLLLTACNLRSNFS